MRRLVLPAVQLEDSGEYCVRSMTNPPIHSHCHRWAHPRPRVTTETALSLGELAT